jgi:hypothetical protein
VIDESELPGGTVQRFMVIDQIDSIRSQLVVLVGWFNQRGAYSAALKTQMALVAIDDIGCASDADFEESFP